MDFQLWCATDIENVLMKYHIIILEIVLTFLGDMPAI
jgi:hypothetical protein